MKIELKIKKPDDSRDYFPTVEISSENFAYLSKQQVSSFNRNMKDPVHSGLVNWWKSTLNRKERKLNWDSGPLAIYVGSLPIALELKGNRYIMNGKSETLNTITNALARVTFTAIREKNSVKLMKSLMTVLTLSETTKYCLENRMPYHYYDNFDKVEVRLAVQQISDKECAIEVSDGVWGVIKNKDLDDMCKFFINRKKKTKFAYFGIKKLFTFTMGREPSDGELKLMREFLKQNRQQDIVEERAIQLLNEMAEQYKDRLNLDFKGDKPYRLFIKGKHYDWLLSDTEYKSEIQKVSTYVLQPVVELNDDGNPVPLSECKWAWRGPICIDNMSAGSSLGDQFAARAMALLNDNMTIQIVNTIRRYLISEPNKNRRDFDEMRGLWGN
jgi:hypothetical protein